MYLEFLVPVRFVRLLHTTDGRVIRTPPPTIQAVQTRRINCDHSWKSEISDKNLVPIYIVYFRCYGTNTGKYRAAGIRCWSQIPEGTCV